MADELVAKYDAMSQDFRGQSENLLREILNGFNQSMESSKKNYINLQEGYSKGYVDIVDQAKKANTEMLGNLARNYGELKSNINNLYTQLQKNVVEAYNKSISDFTTQCESVIKKYPHLTPYNYKEASKQLANHQAKLLDDFAKRYKETTELMEKKYKALVHELKFPDVPPPNLTMDGNSTGKKK